MRGARGPIEMAEVRELLRRAVDAVRRAQEAARANPAEGSLAALAEAREALQDLRDGFDELAVERGKLEARVGELEAALELKPELIRHHGLYWCQGDPDPWCPNCWENEQRAVHLNPTDILAGRLAVCRRCNYSVNLDNVAPPRAWRRRA